MADNEGKTPVALESDIYAERDVWAIRDSYNTYVNAGQSTEQVLGALASNRGQFEPLREQYARVVYEEGGIEKAASRKRKVYFKELNRLYSATEAIKDELRKRGAFFEIDEFDEEHPNAAYRRFLKKWEAERRAQSSCHVVTALYGEQSRELAQARRVCRRRFVLNPWIFPSWVLYRILGPFLAHLARRGDGISSQLQLMLARPIVQASHHDLRVALPWILYLGLFGWTFIGMAVLMAIG